MKHAELWRRMETAPRDGSSFDVLCVSKDGVKVEVKDLHYAPRPMNAKDHSDLILWGSHQFLSRYLTPIGWKPTE